MDNTGGSLGTADAISQHLANSHPDRFGSDAGKIRGMVDKVINSGVSVETKSGAMVTHHGGKTVIRRPDGTGTMVMDPNGNWAKNLLDLEGLK